MTKPSKHRTYFLVGLRLPPNVTRKVAIAYIREALEQWSYNTAVGFVWDHEEVEMVPGPLYGLGDYVTVQPYSK